MSESKHKAKLNDATVVVSPKNPTHYFRKLNNRKFWLGMLAIVIIFLAGWGIYKLLHKKNNIVVGTECSTATQAPLLRQAAQYYSPVDFAQLQPVVNKIKQIPNYQKDPNCLFPIVVFYINISDYKNAQAYFNKLQMVYVPSQGFSKALAPTRSLASLRANINVLKQNYQNAKLRFSRRP